MWSILFTVILVLANITQGAGIPWFWVFCPIWAPALSFSIISLAMAIGAKALVKENNKED